MMKAKKIPNNNNSDYGFGNYGMLFISLGCIGLSIIIMITCRPFLISLHRMKQSANQTDKEEEDEDNDDEKPDPKSTAASA